MDIATSDLSSALYHPVTFALILGGLILGEAVRVVHWWQQRVMKRCDGGIVFGSWVICWEVD